MECVHQRVTLSTGFRFLSSPLRISFLTLRIGCMET